MKKQSLIFGILSLLIFATAFQMAVPATFFQQLAKKLDTYHRQYPYEKTYVQTDKTIYKLGETIWFNAFVLDRNQKASFTSDVLYVDLLDPQGKVAQKSELQIQGGSAHGDFRLDENDRGGIYQVRAYTHWMKNFGEEVYFTKKLQVQRVITPRLLLNLDFEKEAYGPGEEVIALLKAENLKNEKLQTAPIAFSVQLDGKDFLQSETTTDQKGEARVIFKLPEQLNNTDGLLNIIVQSAGKTESISRAIPIVLDQINLKFFPEGGHYFADTKANVAFKALNEFNKGADVSGSIVDDENRLITSFESFHMGMGAFDFVPDAGKKYFARIESPPGNQQLIPLPASLKKGLSLQLSSHDSTSLSFEIQSTEKAAAYLVATALGDMVYQKELNVSQGANAIKIDTKDFPMGIAAFTLFDEEGLPLSERLVFVNPYKGLQISLKTDKNRYKPREKVKLRVKTTDYQGNPVKAKLSLAVVDDQLISFADDKQDNILSAMLLSSEVWGEIQEPSFYFDPEEKNASKALDYLLMTQGWRRFNWSEVDKPKAKVTYVPEKVSNIVGRVINQRGKGFSTQVTLMEMSGKKRIVVVETTPEGNFTFKNTDPSVTVMLVTKKSGSIRLQSAFGKSMALGGSGNLILMEASEIVVSESSESEDGDQKEESDEEVQSAGLDLSLSPDSQSLGEVIVTGYGLERKEILGVTIERVSPENIGNLPGSFANALQGQVAGVLIQNASGNVGSAESIIIRGQSSLSANGQPLYIVDGYIVTPELNGGSTVFNTLNPHDITSISVIKSPQATALYGVAGNNGVIVINTRSKYYNYSRHWATARYKSRVVSPRKFTVTREFYRAVPSDDEIREDFETTVHWQHSLVTNKKGEASAEFYNNDAVSAFRITAEGFSQVGTLGRQEEVYFTRLPVSVDVKFPEFLGFEDQLKLPVSITNETDKALSGIVTMKLSPGLGPDRVPRKTVTLPAGQTKTFYFKISPQGREGEYPVVLNFNSPGYKDEITHTFKVRPVGFPVNFSVSAKTLDRTMPITIGETEQNSMRAMLTVYPDVLSDLFDGAQSILRSPYGCFEQVSSSNYPNVLALQFMEASGDIDAASRTKALRLLDDGYKRMAAYEVKGGGFEWFGKPPAHEGLTAFGLIQFTEMQKVYDGVSSDLIKRTEAWLMQRRNGKGGFKQIRGKYDGFAGIKTKVTNAYITYALSESGITSLDTEFNAVYKEAIKSQDMYRMALVALIAQNLNKSAEYQHLIDIFKSTIDQPEFEAFEADYSIVTSYGHSLQTEIWALWAIALLKENRPDLPLVDRAINTIAGKRKYGGFGSTQATGLALKALTGYAAIVNSRKSDGAVELLINGKAVGEVAYKADNKEKLQIDFSNKLRDVMTENVRVRFKGTDEPMAYAIDVDWYAKQPMSSYQTKIELATSLNRSRVGVNETVRLSARLSNKTNGGIPMTVAVLGIPAGLSLQPWQLKEMQEQEVFDFYEITDGNLVIYYREMGPGAAKVLNFDLKADVPGEYLGAASYAYLYYTDEYKHYTKGEKIVIDE